MRMVNMREAKTHLSRLVERAALGEGFIIAKAGKPMVKVVPLATGEAQGTSRLGFLKGQRKVPDDFDRIGDEEIRRLFEGAADDGGP
ncbi:MAG: type II toxin-antitoxin system prevent-host-death family antitoxin [Alphaproteobacteria bacterium]|nr:type II toxin-antitoxin system prevent-host-death family antitoxin [Alphaproteobacteria bacterium]